jgi:hypothetical protein
VLGPCDVEGTLLGSKLGATDDVGPLDGAVLGPCDVEGTSLGSKLGATEIVGFMLGVDEGTKLGATDDVGPLDGATELVGGALAVGNELG